MKEEDVKKEDIKEAAREGYARAARSGCDCRARADSRFAPSSDEVAMSIGYSEEEIGAAPDGSNPPGGATAARSSAGSRGSQPGGEMLPFLTARIEQ